MKTMLHPKTCAHCGATFGPKHWHKPGDWAKAEFCSRACSSKSRMISVDRDFFSARTNVAQHGCIEWSASRDRKGYGRCKPHQGEVLAHRVSWTVINGPIPDGMHVLHTCDNPSCVNPDHLFLGTNADNVADREEKGRSRPRRGEMNGRAKLSATAVSKIRSLEIPQSAVASMFSVSQATVSSIKCGRTWRGQ